MGQRAGTGATRDDTGAPPPGSVTFDGDHHLRVGECDFHLDFPRGNVPPGHLGVMKPWPTVEAYIELCRSLRPETVVEIGIHSGGSTALLAELLAPRKLVALELSDRPVPLLTEYLVRRSRTETVRPYYGVDQGDRRRVEEIVEQELGGGPVDLVIDDASHLYEPTLASFEVLFPRVAPGGLYVIEDWRWEHNLASALAAMISSDHEDADAAAAAVRQANSDLDAGVRKKEVPFSRLVHELLLARAEGEMIEGLAVTASWVVVRRGPGRLDPASFRLRDLYHDHFEQLGARAS